MQYFRIMSELYHLDPYASSANAGRWNPKGTSMIYAASSPALAQLEYLCIKGNVVTATRWFMITYEIAKTDSIGALDKATLPPDWNVLPHGKATQAFGQAWLKENEFPFLRVPSARLALAFYPQEHNLLINPAYAGLKKILKVTEHVPFGFLLG